MRQVKVLLFVVLAVLVAVNAAMAREPIIMTVKLISGYAPGEFALKGEIFLQVERIAKEIESKARQGGELRIMITGTTDVTGKSPANDQLAMARAEQVRAYLASKFPDAKTYSYSRGQDLDARQVWVEYVLFAKEKNKSISQLYQSLTLWERIAVGIMFAGITVFICLIFLSIMGVFSKKQTPTTVNSERPKGLNGVSWITVGDYKVLVERQEGKFVSPFRVTGGGKIIRDDRRGLIESLKGCLKSVVFAEQKERLMKLGKIKVAENTEVKE